MNIEAAAVTFPAAFAAFLAHRHRQLPEVP